MKGGAVKGGKSTPWNPPSRLIGGIAERLGICGGRPPEMTSGLQDRKAPIQTQAMRTGSFHQPTSLLSILMMPARLPTPHLQSKQRLDGYVCVAFEASIPPD